MHTDQLNPKILICTVGGSHEPIVKSISELNPSFVCFVCSEDNLATGDKGSYTQIEGKGLFIKKNYKDEKPSLPNIPTQTNLKPEQYEILKVPADDFDEIYIRLTAWIDQRLETSTSIIADFTGGTKSMSACMAIAALDYPEIELSFVIGSRSDLVKVDSGSERVSRASVSKLRFQRNLSAALQPWSRFAYDESLSLLDKIQVPQDPVLAGKLQRARDLSQALSFWDRFQHRKAAQIFNRYSGICGKSSFWREYLTNIKNITAGTERETPLRLFDLWNNALRRASQGRYDDAVSRTYRLIEWSAQWLLDAQANIKTVDIPEDKIPAGLSLQKNKEGKYQSGLYLSWELLAHYETTKVKAFWSDEQSRLMDLIKIRNHSILAHGFDPLDESNWQLMQSWVEEKLIPLLHHFAMQKPLNIKNIPGQLPNKAEL